MDNHLSEEEKAKDPFYLRKREFVERYEGFGKSILSKIKAPGSSYNSFLLRICLKCKGKRVLDVGCGKGAIDFELAKRGREVVGVDLYSERLPLSRSVRRFKASRLLGSIDFINADGTKLPFRAGSFDTALLFDVLEHVGDELTFLREVGRVANRILLHVPSDREPPFSSMLRITWSNRISREHLRYYSKDSIYDLAKSINFEVKWMEGRDGNSFILRFYDLIGRYPVILAELEKLKSTATQ